MNRFTFLTQANIRDKEIFFVCVSVRECLYCWFLKMLIGFEKES